MKYAVSQYNLIEKEGWLQKISLFRHRDGVKWLTLWSSWRA
jgi:hypothetical protein